jgi:hypothetical protein
MSRFAKTGAEKVDSGLPLFRSQFFLEEYAIQFAKRKHGPSGADR